ncbi:MAG: NADH-quinone oxidoreductase subunit B family protein [Candidatus Aquicultorales bacterium]
MKTFSLLNLTSCTGCSVNILNAFNDHPEWLGERLRYSEFLISEKAKKRTDVLLVEGGVGTDEDLVKLKEFAALSDQVVVIGTCASFGFISSFGNYRDIGELIISRLGRKGRGRLPWVIERVRPVGEVVDADLYIPGCPLPGHLIAGFMMDATPRVSKVVCGECPRKLAGGKFAHVVPDYGGLAPGPECLLQQGYLCLGLVTQGGCGAPCPTAAAHCIGCRGPAQHLAALPPMERIDKVVATLHRRTTADLTLLRKELAAPTSLLFLYPFSPEFSKPPGYEPGRVL